MQRIAPLSVYLVTRESWRLLERTRVNPLCWLLRAAGKINEGHRGAQAKRCGLREWRQIADLGLEVRVAGSVFCSAMDCCSWLATLLRMDATRDGCPLLTQVSHDSGTCM